MQSMQQVRPQFIPVDIESKREQAIDRLTQAFAADIMPIESYEHRVALAQSARADADLAAALEGIPDFDARPSAASDHGRATESNSSAAQAARRGSLRFDPRILGNSTMACVMGNTDLKGDWLEGDTIESFTMMGSVRLDLRETALPAGRLKIDAFVLMGDVKVIVPAGLPVKLNGIPFMGDLRTDRDISRRVEPGQPYLEVNAFVLMGSLRILSGG